MIRFCISFALFSALCIFFLFFFLLVFEKVKNGNKKPQTYINMNKYT